MRNCTVRSPFCQRPTVKTRLPAGAAGNRTTHNIGRYRVPPGTCRCHTVTRTTVPPRAPRPVAATGAPKSAHRKIAPGFPGPWLTSRIPRQNGGRSREPPGGPRWKPNATALGPVHRPLLQLLLIGGLVLAVPWWAHRRHRARVRVQRTIEAWPRRGKVPEAPETPEDRGGSAAEGTCGLRSAQSPVAAADLGQAVL